MRDFTQEENRIYNESLNKLFKPTKETCRWNLSNDDCNAWSCDTCGTDWILSEGNPQDNMMNYCMGCGRKIIY